MTAMPPITAPTDLRNIGVITDALKSHTAGVIARCHKPPRGLVEIAAAIECERFAGLWRGAGQLDDMTIRRFLQDWSIGRSWDDGHRAKPATDRHG